MSDDIAADVAAIRSWMGGDRTLLDEKRLERVLAFLEDQSRLCVALAERCKAQAELLGKRAEKEGER